MSEGKFFRFGNTLNITAKLLAATGPSEFEQRERDMEILHLRMVLNIPDPTKVEFLRRKWTSCQIHALSNLALTGRKIEIKDESFTIT